MADMVKKFSAVTLSNEILNYEIYMTAAIVTKMNEGSSLIIIQKFIIFFKSFNLHREHRNIVNHLGSRLVSSGCSIHRLIRALYREPLLLPEETNRTHLHRGACDWFFWKRKSPLLSVRLGLFSSKKLFCLFHSASRRENEKSYKVGGHGTRIFSGNSVK